MTVHAFHSPSWYRVENLRPALKTQAQVRRHAFRGQVWHVVRDPASGRFNRMSPATYQCLGLLDGRRTVQEVWQLAIAQMGDDAPGQEEVIGLLSQLHAADLLLCEVSPDTAELFERAAKHDKSRRPSAWKNPFSIRIPLWDPDRFLTRSLPWLRPFFGWSGALVFTALLLLGAVLAGLHWPELGGNLGDRVFAADNLLVLWLCFPVVKFLHEMGHAYAVKAGGGEVHEMGIMLLVFMPVPYVDASAAGGFRSKWQRTLVGASGMLVELWVAALFMLVWVAVEPGLLRAVAFNVMLIASVSTVVFNANPLLRFDGYYMLSDLTEIPNLASRGSRYWRYLFERYLFRMREPEVPQTSAGERRWFLGYTPLALLYRLSVAAAIMLYVASEWFFIGVLLAVWGAVAMLVMPLAKTGGYLLALPRAGRVRRRALAITGGVLGLLLALLFLLPAPMRVMTEGVVWLPEEANVRAGADGFVRAVHVRAGAQVAPGAALIESHDPVATAEIRLIEARIAELEARLDQQRFIERVEAQNTQQELAHERERLRRAVERSGQLVARSLMAGRFVLEHAQDLEDRYFRKGELLGYVIPAEGAQQAEVSRIVRVVVSQDDVDLVRERLAKVDVRAAQQIDQVYSAQLVREVPAAKDQLPSIALSSEGGGLIAADPRDPKTGKTLTSNFQFDLRLAAGAPPWSYGGRVYVRLSLQPEPLGWQAFRRLRQLFLAQFHV